MFGSSLPKNETAGHSIYDPTKSETFINGSQPFSVAYVGDFGANGYLGYDTITLGNLTIENTTIGVATELTGDVVYTGSDGIIGLEPLGAASSPFVTAVFKEVEVEILTFDLRNDSTGTIDFGYVDPDLFAPDAELTTIPTSGFGWQLSQVSFVVNGEIVGDPASGVTLGKSTKSQPIFPRKHCVHTNKIAVGSDTGGEVIAVSANTAKAYWAPLVADGSVITTIPGPYGEGTLYIIPCTTKLPDLTIIFGNPSDPDGNATITGDTLQRTGWPRGNGSKPLHSNIYPAAVQCSYVWFTDFKLSFSMYRVRLGLPRWLDRRPALLPVCSGDGLWLTANNIRAQGKSVKVKGAFHLL